MPWNQRILEEALDIITYSISTPTVLYPNKFYDPLILLPTTFHCPSSCLHCPIRVTEALLCLNLTSSYVPGSTGTLLKSSPLLYGSTGS